MALLSCLSAQVEAYYKLQKKNKNWERIFLKMDFFATLIIILKITAFQKSDKRTTKFTKKFRVPEILISTLFIHMEFRPPLPVIPVH